MTLTGIHVLANQGIKLYAINKDPLTAHAAGILAAVTALPLNEPQQNAAIVLKRQVEAHGTLFLDPL